MSVIKVRCTDQVLAYENTPVIASGGLDENFVAFTFCSQWDGFEKTAVFWRSEDEVYHCTLGTEDTCPLPPEVTMDDGIIWLGAFGVDATGRQRTSEVLSYRIVKGAITEGAKPSEPTPEIYTQILAEVAGIRQLADEVKAREEDFEAAQHRASVEHVNAVAAMWAEYEEKAEEARLAFEQYIAEMVTAGMIPDNSVTALKLTNGSVTTDKIASSAVTSAKLASAAVKNANIADGTILAAKLNNTVLQGTNIKLTATLAALFGLYETSQFNVAAVLDAISTTRAKIQTGTYSGTGRSGTASNGNTLTFDFAPLIVAVSAEFTDWSSPLLFVAGSETTRHIADSGSEIVDVSWSGNSLTWYATDVMFQHNTAGETYTYVAIG